MHSELSQRIEDENQIFEDALAVAKRVRAMHSELSQRIEDENQIFHHAVQRALERQAKQIEQIQEALSDRIERSL